MVGRRAFPVSAANLWNSLPTHLISAPSRTIFRQRLKTFSFPALLPGLNVLNSGHIVDLAVTALYIGHIKQLDDDDDDDDLPALLARFCLETKYFFI